ncbi:hypothetical protein BRADI_5g03646v3 [Brachypodium distachyon]|uniref:Secreted protein n=1 Tax=Brachypodium distachyon TaxID=15368 RepID=A0A0Q3E2M8_BRADI|nr:hypothetical protein BRADI_5g03646v3 [Brachypodium distachyon]
MRGPWPCPPPPATSHRSAAILLLPLAMLSSSFVIPQFCKNPRFSSVYFAKKIMTNLRLSCSLPLSSRLFKFCKNPRFPLCILPKKS